MITLMIDGDNENTILKSSNARRLRPSPAFACVRTRSTSVDHVRRRRCIVMYRCPRWHTASVRMLLYLFSCPNKRMYDFLFRSIQMRFFFFFLFFFFLLLLLLLLLWLGRIACSQSILYACYWRTCWLRGTVGERRSLTSELSLSHAWPVVWRVATYVDKPSAIGQPTRPTQPFILSRSINWVVSNFIGCVLVAPSGECSRG